jgi:hypothetical protein
VGWSGKSLVDATKQGNSVQCPTNGRRECLGGRPTVAIHRRRNTGCDIWSHVGVSEDLWIEMTSHVGSRRS